MGSFLDEETVEKEKCLMLHSGYLSTGSGCISIWSIRTVKNCPVLLILDSKLL